jgi:hypothetical protein
MSDDIQARVRHDIDETGWHLVMVPPEDGTPGWTHTLGLWERYEHPEIVVFGPELEKIGPLANHIGALVRAGRRFEADAEEEGILADHPMAFRAVAAKWLPVFLGNAAWHYESEQFPALQAFWPDPGGHFPWQPGADRSWRDDQPRLHESNTLAALSEAMVGVLRREGAL